MCCTLPYWSRMASTGHTGPQAPQSMHSSGQMMCNALRSPVIASVGQRFTHAVQPMQVSMMRKAMDGPLYRQSVEHPIYDHAGDRHVRPDGERPHGQAPVLLEALADRRQPDGAQDERQADDGEDRMRAQEHQVEGAEGALVAVDAGEGESGQVSHQEERGGREGGSH